MNVVKMLVPTSKYGLKCPYKMTAEEICVHNTANDASARNEAKYMINNNTSTSYHVVIDDKEIIQTIPFERNAFHAGDGSTGRGNRYSIGIEICYSKSGGARFNKAEEKAAEYIATLLKERNWGIEKVKRHYDYSKKYCPHRTMDLGWDRFLNMIKKYLSQENNQGGDEEVRVYQNGSTSEPVYADTSCTVKIGSLDPRESCDCFGIFNNRAMVRYQVGSSGNYKIGFCKWLGGVK